MGHGIKFVARYEERWWLDAGLSGLGLGGGPVSILMDATVADASGGTLLGFVVVTSKVAAEHGDALADEQSGCAAFVSQIADYLGPVADARELADRLSQTPGVVEHGLFEPELVSNIVIAGGGGVERRSGAKP